MKTILYLLSFLLFSEVLSIPSICNQNEGNIAIKEAFLWKNTLFLITENDRNLKINNFQWNGSHFIGDVKDWTQSMADNQIIFTVKHPKEGIVALKWEKVDDIEQYSGTLFMLDSNQKLNRFDSIEPNYYSCNPTVAGIKHQICSIFLKFPEENIENNLLSITSFPINYEKYGLHDRLFVFYKEIPNDSKICNQKRCYKMWRYIFTRYITINGTNWIIDSTTKLNCVDRNDGDVTASTSLSEYEESGANFYFDWIEFSGLLFNVFQISLTKQSINDIKAIKRGYIGELFGCKQSNTLKPITTLPPETPSKSPPDPQPKTSSDSSSDSSPNLPQKSPPEPLSSSTTEGPKTSWLSPMISMFLLIVLIVFLISFGFGFWYFNIKDNKKSVPSDGKKEGSTSDKIDPQSSSQPQSQSLTTT